ncbi:adenylosuccinate lyase, partial [Candidatus Roizmanbacteria bacterium]|nr:adenylosuccinate lyase [Candidatus Roizmanbacteria bacterium]
MRLQFSYGIDEAITPIDGRNKNKLIALTRFLSDLALDKYRIMIEVEYLKKLSQSKVVRRLTVVEKKELEKLHKDFKSSDYQEIRTIELETNHEMKAVEKFIQRRLVKTSLRDVAGMIHFGLTTDDVNNTAYALMIKNSLKEVIIPHLALIVRILHEKAKSYKNIPMLSRTHGQPAIPTTVGKEFLIFYKRLHEELEILKKLENSAKLTGNVGNLNAHKFLFHKINWLKFSQEFIESFNLKPDLVTTQIEPYDSLIRLFQTLGRINSILVGLCQDFWIYISFGYFKQKVIQKEVGSTALPHKVNPIYFEGAEG